MVYCAGKLIENLKLFHNVIMVLPRGGYSHTLPFRVCAAQRGRDFEAPDLERGIKNCGSLLYLLLKIVADCEEVFI